MSVTLGLDLGTTSIGWALIDHKKQELIDCGVRVFPIGVNVDKSGSESPKNVQRRQARMIRRQYHRFKLRRKNLSKNLKILGMLPDPDGNLAKLSAKELYNLRRKAISYPGHEAEKLTPEEIGRIFLHLNQHRGFKSSRKQGSAVKPDEDQGQIKTEITKMKETIQNGGFKTVGHYFASLFDHDLHNQDEPETRIRGRHVGRDLYMEEFDEIWKAQQKFYPEVLTGSPEDGNKPKATAYFKIKHYCIFYQRPLKSQKHTISKCRFEPKLTVTPKANPDFQEFRFWQDLEKLRLSGEGRWNDPLFQEEKEYLFQHFGFDESFKANTIPGKLKYGRRVQVNDPDMKLSGQTTFGRIKRAIGVSEFDKLTELQRNQLWNLLFFFEDDDKLIHLTSTLETLFHWTPETAMSCAKVRLEEGYSSLSLKAIRKILPFMRTGMGYADAAKAAGYHHSYNRDENDPARVLTDRIVIAEGDRIRNPVVSRALAETTKVVNAIIKIYGGPDEIRVELTRELKSPKNKRENMRRNNIEREQIKKNLADFLSEKTGKTYYPNSSEVGKLELWMEMGMEQGDFFKTEDLKKELSPALREKFRLWMEGNRISVYTGNVISFSQMLSEEIQIEHIIPYSLSMDNSFANKSLCEHSINIRKGNKTAFEYFEGLGENEFRAFKERVKWFPNHFKRDRFLMKDVPEGFEPGAIENTGYIARTALGLFKTVCKKVTVTNGAATSTLRRLWGLNSVIVENETGKKDRTDHRHHALDAIVIALTTLPVLRTLTDYSKFNELSKLENDHISPPWPLFFPEIKEKIGSTLISYRSDKKLIEKHSWKMKAGKGKQAWVKQSGISIRGTLHNDTVFGEIQTPNQHHERLFVTRRPLGYLKSEKHFEMIVDKGTRELLYNHWKKNGEDFKQAFGDLDANPVYSNPALKIPIKTVRMAETSNSMVDRFQGSARPEEKGKQFVEPGNNYLYVLYGNPNNPTEKRELEMVSFFEAVSRFQAKKPIYPAEKNGKTFLIALKQGDLVIPYEKHPDEIDFRSLEINKGIYRVIKFDISGKIVLGLFLKSGIKADSDQFPLILRKMPNTLRAKAVKINILGKPIQVNHDQENFNL